MRAWLPSSSALGGLRAAGAIEGTFRVGGCPCAPEKDWRLAIGPCDVAVVPSGFEEVGSVQSAEAAIHTLQIHYGRMLVLVCTDVPRKMVQTGRDECRRVVKSRMRKQLERR